MKQLESPQVAQGYQNLLTISQACRVLPKQTSGRHVHPSTIHRWIKSGSKGVRLHATRIGGRVYIRPSDLDEFINKRSSASPGASAARPIIDLNVEENLVELGALQQSSREATDV